MTKENTPLWYAEQELETLLSSEADEAAIEAAEAEVTKWKLKTREFAIGMITERFN